MQEVTEARYDLWSQIALLVDRLANQQLERLYSDGAGQLG